MKLFKSASTSSPARSRPANSAIRGKISGPIPIPNPAMADDEFPIRNPGTGLADKSPEEEFPMRPALTSTLSSVTNPPRQAEQEPEAQQPQLEEPPHQNHQSQYEHSRQHNQHQHQQHLHHHHHPSSSRSVSGGSRTATESQPAPMTPSPEPAAPSDDQVTARQPSPVAMPAQSAPPAAPEQPPEAPSTPRPAPAVINNPSPQSAAAEGSSPGTRRTTVPSTVRYSVISNTSAAASQPQRKKSTIRNALSKLFGRKKKKSTSVSSSVGDTDRTSTVLPSQHRSDTSGLARVKEVESKRSASLPITEYDRALRSHSVGPNDFTTIENVRNSVHIDSGTPRRRAATVTNSKLFGSPAKRFELGEWGGLSPRPVSAQGRNQTSRDGDDPSMIGRAITSDMDGTYNPKRRSRSLSGLDLVAIADGGALGGRRRSDEIRYWRESYGASHLSPLSSTHAETEGDNVDYPNNDDNNDTGVISIDPTQSLAAQPPQRVAPDSPPQPFNFGSFATMSEMAGMKITHAASLETRFGNVEGRLGRLEQVVDQLCHAVPEFKYGPRPVSALGASQVPRSMAGPGLEQFSNSSHLRDPRADQMSSHYTSSRHSVETDEHTAHSHMSFGEGQTFIGSLHPPSSATTQPPHFSTASPYGGPGSSAFRPTSTSTVRGATSMPALSVAAASDAAAELAAQLEAERAQRATLELQVRKLSERVNALSTTMYAMLRDPQKNRSQERLTPLSAGEGRLSRTSSNGRLGTPTKVPLASSGVNSRHSPGAPVSIVLEPAPRLGRFQSSGMTLSAFEDDDDGESEQGAESMSESFMTPREEYPPHSYGAFGEELREDLDDAEDADPKRKKAARTLSLSQLTLNKDQKAVASSGHI